MNKMKALLWREYMLGRRKMLFSLLAFVMVTILSWLVLISIKHGNLEAAFKNLDKEMPGMSQGLAQLVFYAAMFVPAQMSISLIMENGAVAADLKSGWRLFNRTLPVTAAESMGAKYILKGITIAAVFLVDLGHFAVVSLLADKEMKIFYINVLLLLFNINLLSELIKGVVLYSAKTEKEMVLADFAPCVIMIILCIPYYFSLKKSVSGIAADDNLQMTFKIIGVIADDIKTIFPYMLPVMIALFGGGYFLHLMAMRRAEK